MVSLVVVDDQPMVRRGIRLLLEAEQDFVILANPDTTLAAVEAITHFKPDFFLIDLMLPPLRGLWVLGQLRRKFPHSLAVVMSIHDDLPIVKQALADGASGYVL